MMASKILNLNLIKSPFKLMRFISTSSIVQSSGKSDGKSSSKQTAIVYTNRKFEEEENMVKPNNVRLALMRESKITITEPEDVTVTTGVPEEHYTTRRVRIFKPAKNAMQSGTFNTRRWKIEFENRERWENPLMGWTSTGDPLSNLIVWFDSAQDAADYCDRNGWHYDIEQPIERRNLNKNYAENFSWNKRTRVGTK